MTQLDRLSLLIADHFAPAPVETLRITERVFPARVRADLQRALEELIADDLTVLRLTGVTKAMSFGGVSISGLLVPSRQAPALAVPPEYEEVDTGETHPVRCLKTGLWFLEGSQMRFLVLMSTPDDRRFKSDLTLQFAGLDGARETEFAADFLAGVERLVQEARSYRGKILSLERGEMYHGKSTGIRVHQLGEVTRAQLILPASTIELLDRNVIHFAQQRQRLADLGLSAKKGLLFYGPPGTGKTHTIHYLASALEGHTTLLITAEQVGLLDEYMTLARLLQPSVVVLEDVDLIARDRMSQRGDCSEVLLNKLLNEMDGLRPDAAIFFVLTTNRPEVLEASLASRPGRIDQAIEFPLPDDRGRGQLVELYAPRMELAPKVREDIVRRTEGVSASFIKELMRRSTQYALERDPQATAIVGADVDSALDELLVAGGALNRVLLGGRAEER